MKIYSVKAKKKDKNSRNVWFLKVFKPQLGQFSIFLKTDFRNILREIWRIFWRIVCLNMRNLNFFLYGELSIFSPLLKNAIFVLAWFPNCFADFCWKNSWIYKLANLRNNFYKRCFDVKHTQACQIGFYFVTVRVDHTVLMGRNDLWLDCLYPSIVQLEWPNDRMTECVRT